MKAVAPLSFYVVILRKDGKPIGHGVTFSESEAREDFLPQLISSNESKKEEKTSSVSEILDSFLKVMETYRKFIPITMKFAPHISQMIAASSIIEFAERQGFHRIDLSAEERNVFELSLDLLSEYNRRDKDTLAAISGVSHLPEVMIIGLISAYDSFISRLLRCVISTHEEIIMVSEKSIKYSELSQFETITHFRDSIIAKEVDAIARDSHASQFDWLSKKFGVKLKEHLDVWHQFIEICERRNLLTHTGGVVTDIYLRNCKKYGVPNIDLSIGDRLVVDDQYFSEAVDIIHEVGTKLAHEIWRKFYKSEKKQADSDLNDLGLDLIHDGSYRLAEKFLSFGIKLKPHSSDRIRRMMFINLANCINLQGNKEEAQRLLGEEDWSATGVEFRISVASILGETEKVVRMMKQMGTSGSLSSGDYRDWPVFRGMRKEPEFIEAFEEIFGEPMRRINVLRGEHSDGADDLEVEES